MLMNELKAESNTCSHTPTKPSVTFRAACAAHAQSAALVQGTGNNTITLEDQIVAVPLACFVNEP
ncbi:protein FAM65A-like X9, partial [Biomphalaria pfeifferi]